MSVSAGAQLDTHGKSEAQILAMGWDKWDAFYSAKVGSSTADMSDMNEIFGQAALHRNQRMVKKGNAAKIEKLRKLMGAFASDAVDVGYNLSGGGTMWTPVSAGITGSTELALYGVLGGTPPQDNQSTKRKVGALLNQLSALLTKEHNDKDADGYFKFGNAKSSLGKMRAEFAQISATIGSMSRDNQNRVYGFCADFTKTARAEWN